MKLRAQEHTKYTNHYSLLNKKENKRKQKKQKTWENRRKLELLASGLSKSLLPGQVELISQANVIHGKYNLP